jgi:hypothetical protein
MRFMSKILQSLSLKLNVKLLCDQEWQQQDLDGACI